MEIDRLSIGGQSETTHLLFVIDLAGDFIYLNQHWSQLLGWQDKQLHGKSYVDLIHPDDRDAVLKELKGLQSDELKEKQLKHRILTSRDDYYVLEWKACKVDVDQIAGIAKESAAMSLLSVQNQESHLLLKQVEKMARVGHWRVNLLSQHLYWSDEVYRIHGLDKKAYTPTVESAIDFYHPADREKVERLVQDAMRSCLDPPNSL